MAITYKYKVLSITYMIFQKESKIFSLDYYLHGRT